MYHQQVPILRLRFITYDTQNTLVAHPLCESVCQPRTAHFTLHIIRHKFLQDYRHTIRIKLHTTFWSIYLQHTRHPDRTYNALPQSLSRGRFD